MTGNVWPLLLPNALALASMATLFICLAYRKITKRLDG
jgi:ABC-2 type transport system permease protein